MTAPAGHVDRGRHVVDGRPRGRRARPRRAGARTPLGAAGRQREGEARLVARRVDGGRRRRASPSPRARRPTAAGPCSPRRPGERHRPVERRRVEPAAGDVGHRHLAPVPVAGHRGQPGAVARHGVVAVDDDVELVVRQQRRRAAGRRRPTPGTAARAGRCGSRRCCRRRSGPPASRSSSTPCGLVAAAVRPAGSTGWARRRSVRRSGCPAAARARWCASSRTARARPWRRARRCSTCTGRGRARPGRPSGATRAAAASAADQPGPGRGAGPRRARARARG